MEVLSTGGSLRYTPNSVPSLLRGMGTSWGHLQGDHCSRLAVLPTPGLSPTPGSLPSLRGQRVACSWLISLPQDFIKRYAEKERPWEGEISTQNSSLQEDSWLLTLLLTPKPLCPGSAAQVQLMVHQKPKASYGHHSPTSVLPRPYSPRVSGGSCWSPCGDAYTSNSAESCCAGHQVSLRTASSSSCTAHIPAAPSKDNQRHSQLWTSMLWHHRTCTCYTTAGLSPLLIFFFFSNSRSC